MKRTLRVACPTCHGRQVAWVGHALVDCPDCSGYGWISVTSLLADGIVGLALFVAFAVCVLLVAP